MCGVCVACVWRVWRVCACGVLGCLSACSPSFPRFAWWSQFAFFNRHARTWCGLGTQVSGTAAGFSVSSSSPAFHSIVSADASNVAGFVGDVLYGAVEGSNTAATALLLQRSASVDVLRVTADGRAAISSALSVTGPTVVTGATTVTGPATLSGSSIALGPAQVTGNTVVLSESATNTGTSLLQVVSPASYTADLITGALDGTLGLSNALLLQTTAGTDALRVQSSGQVTASLGLSAPAGVSITGSTSVSSATSIGGTGVWGVTGALTVGSAGGRAGLLSFAGKAALHWRVKGRENGPAHVCYPSIGWHAFLCASSWAHPLPQSPLQPAPLALGWTWPR